MKKKPIFEEWKMPKNPDLDHGCPECGWEYPCDFPEDRYIIRDGKCLIIKNYWKEIEDKWAPFGVAWVEDKEITKHIKEKIYFYTKNGWRGYEGDQNWDEYHKCPYCNKEWNFFNGT